MPNYKQTKILFSFTRILLCKFRLLHTEKHMRTLILVHQVSETELHCLGLYMSRRALGLAMPSCCCFNTFHWKADTYVLVMHNTCHLSYQELKCCVGSSDCEAFQIKLYLTATCACVHLMSSRVEWDCRMSAMNTFFTR